MSYSRIIALLVVAGSAATAFACAPRVQGPDRTMLRGTSASDPVGTIIELRPTLALADTQVSDLRLVKHELERRNKPLRDSLDALGYGNVDPKRKYQRTKEQEERARPLVERMRSNTVDAREAALKLLTDVQKRKLDSVLAIRRDTTGRRPTTRQTR